MDEGRILVTGASSGFGRATALLLAERWPRAKFLLTARRRDRLEEVAALIGAERVRLANFDVRSREEVAAFARDFAGELSEVSVLVNNAGLAAGLDNFQDANLDDLDQMIDTNVKGLIYVTHAVLPFLLRRGGGHIVNLGSVAGHNVYPKGHVYNASKFAVRAFNEALRLDIQGSGVRVTSIDPGLAETEFSLVRFKGDEARAKSVYKGVEALTPEDVAECIFWSLSRPRHVNIQEMLVMPTEQASPRDVFRK